MSFTEIEDHAKLSGFLVERGLRELMRTQVIYARIIGGTYPNTVRYRATFAIPTLPTFDLPFKGSVDELLEEE